MRLKTLIIGLILLVVAGIVLLFLIPWKQQAQPSRKPVMEGKNTDVGKKLPSKSKDTLSINDQLRALSRPSWFTERQWEITLNAIKNGIASNHPIDFYGKVIDQFDEPVDSALVKISVTRFNEGILSNIKARPDLTTAYELMTDIDGIFHLTGCKGYSFEVEKVIKEGYGKISGAPTYYYSNNWGKESFKFDAAKPEIIRILNIEETEPLYKGWMKNYDINSDGTDYFIDLKKRKFEASLTPDSKLIIAITKSEDKREDQKGDFNWNWRYSLKTINGGIIEVDKQTYIAPDSGYEEEVSFATDVLEKVEDNITKNYILQDKEGRFYLIKLYLLYWENDRYLVEVEYYLNPKPGSRNLSYDSLKVLRKWPENQAH